MTAKKHARGEDELNDGLFWFGRVHTANGIVSRDHANILMYQSQRITPKCPLGLQVADERYVTSFASWGIFVQHGRL